jgi:hypothetical protein
LPVICLILVREGTVLCLLNQSNQVVYFEMYKSFNFIDLLRY